MKKTLLTLAAGLAAVSSFALTVEEMTGTYVANRVANEYYLLTGGEDWTPIDDTYLVKVEAGEEVNTLVFNYFLNWEHYAGEANKREAITGVVDIDAKTITFAQQPCAASYFTLTNEAGTGECVATIDDNGAITFADWNVYYEEDDYGFFSGGNVVLTPNPSIDLLCGDKTATALLRDGSNVYGSKDMTTWEEYEWDQNLALKAVGDNEIEFPDFIWNYYTPFLSGTVNWDDMTIEIPVQTVGWYNMCSPMGYDFTGDVAKDPEGNEMTVDYIVVPEVKPIIATISPDFTINIDGIGVYDNGPEYGGLSVYYYFAIEIGEYEAPSVDLSPYCGSYTIEEYSGEDYYCFDYANTEFTPFDYKGAWIVKASQYGNYLQFDNLFVSQDHNYGDYDTVYATVDEEEGTITFASGTSVMYYYELYTYDPETGEAGEDDIVATIAQDGTITFPAWCLYYPSYDYITAFATSHVLTKGGNGVESAMVEGSDEAPVYYNLQGMRLDRPAAGQIVIERRGNKVVKTIVR